MKKEGESISSPTSQLYSYTHYTYHMQKSVTVSVGGGDAGSARTEVVGVDQLAVSQLQCQKVPVALCVEEYSVRRHCLKLQQDGETGGGRGRRRR